MIEVIEAQAISNKLSIEREHIQFGNTYEELSDSLLLYKKKILAKAEESDLVLRANSYSLDNDSYVDIFMNGSYTGLTYKGITRGALAYFVTTLVKPEFLNSHLFEISRKFRDGEPIIISLKKD